MDLMLRGVVFLRGFSGRFARVLADVKQTSWNFVEPFESAPALSVIAAGHGGSPEEVGLAVDDGILWAVPTKRRTVERRMMRRYGAENWPTGKKLLHPKRNLLACKDCGHNYEAGTLCGNCLEVVMTETKAIQDAMLKSWGNNAVDQEVEVVYRGEQPSGETDQKQKRLIEMDRPRPAWFHRNLTDRSMQPERNEGKTLRPSNDLIG